MRALLEIRSDGKGNYAIKINQLAEEMPRMSVNTDSMEGWLIGTPAQLLEVADAIRSELGYDEEECDEI